MSKGYESLKEAVIRDCTERNACGCFNPEGCDKKCGRIGEYGEPGYKCCFHKYCDKFKWVIDRAKHYGEKLGTPWEDILDSWESDRDYWYMNYYQECNQPTMTEAEKLIEIYQQLEDAGLMVTAGKKDAAELMVSHGVVSVIRCRDCIFWLPEFGVCGRYCTSKPGNGYCDIGERRTDA